MNRQFLRRLETVEAARARRQAQAKAASPPPLSCYLIAYFGGHYDPIESPAMNYARGLGLSKATDLAGLTSEQRHERHRAAFARICKRRKIDPATLQPWPAFERKSRQRRGWLWRDATLPVTPDHVSASHD
jgi:hypothetical protein